MPTQHTIIRSGLKWTALVWLNAGVSYGLALTLLQTAWDHLAVIAAVFSFVALYTALDLRLAARGRIDLQQMLLFGVVVKALTQCFPMIEMLTGALAIDAVKATIGEVPWLSLYLITLLDGMLLSGLVLLLTPMYWLLRRIGVCW